MEDLRRHIPPVALEWAAAEPERLWRTVDGTLVFADISGFTALTERLAQRGRVGAEEIVETLNRVFGGMLSQAVERGGELLKFGGDALLFLFQGPDHAQQACDAAIEMRTSLRASAAIPTSVGRLKLSMSVGIHSGDVHLFLVGSPTRELVVLGPAATSVAEVEKAANAGQILVSPGTAERLPSGSVTHAENGLMLKRRRPATTARGRVPLPELPHSILATLFPVALGEYLDPRPPDPEHRSACIAFVRFSGTDALLAGPGPDALAEALHDTVSTLEQCLAREDVTLLATDLDADGGKFFLASGAPRSTEDDEGRMLRAMRALADAGTPLALQIGINRGHVFAAEVGMASRAAYSAMGDTTNTAARIMSKAPKGAVFAHPAVLENSRTLFAATPEGPFAMKGKSVPLLVYGVGEELGTREAGTIARLPYMGRDEDLTELTAAIADALAPAGERTVRLDTSAPAPSDHVMTISGTTGTGKSRLAHEALDAIAAAGIPHTTLALRAEPYGASSSYRVVRDPLRRLLGIPRGTAAEMGDALLASLQTLAPDMAPLAPLIAGLVSVDVPMTPAVAALDPQYLPDVTADAVVRLLDAVQPGPLVITIEEAHWADAASSHLFEKLAIAAEQRQWAILCIRRSDKGGFTPTRARRFELGRLPDAVIEKLVIAATAATPLRPHEISSVVARAEGSPLFVEEVTRVALESGSLDALPDSVQAAMAAQIDLLPRQARQILRYCSVLGRSFRTSVLTEVLRDESLGADVSALGELDAFLKPDDEGRLRFRNSLVRDAAYDGLAYRLRARLHLASGLAMERLSTNPDADAATLALHFHRAGESARTWRYAAMAGAQARKTYANTDAAVQYERALEASRKVPDVTDDDRAAIWGILGELHELAGVLDQSVTAYRHAARLETDPVERAEWMIRRARVHERAGAYVTAMRVVGQARRLLETASGQAAERTRVRLDNLVAIVRLGQERPRDARAWAQTAAQAARGTSDPETLVQALMSLDYADLMLGTPDVGAHTKEALEICIAEGFRPRESVARANLGAYAFYAGRWSESVEWYTSSRRVAVEAGNAFGAAETDLSLGDILLHQGRYDEAEEALSDAVRVLRASGMDFAATYGDMLLSKILLARGSFEAADALAMRATAEFNSLGHTVSAFEAAVVRAEAAIEQGRPDEALTLIADAEAATKGEGAPLLPRAQYARAKAYMRDDQNDLAAAAIEVGLASAREQCIPFEEAMLLQVRSDVKRRSGGADAADSAAADSAASRALLAELGARPTVDLRD